MVGGSVAGGRKRKATEHQALSGVGHLTSMAHDKEIDYIREQLKKDRDLTYTIGSLLRDGTLKTALAGGFKKELPKSKRLPKFVKRWRNLKYGQLGPLLSKLEPTVFTTEFVKPLDLQTMLDP